MPSPAKPLSVPPDHLTYPHLTRQEGFTLRAEPNLRLLFTSVVYVNCVNCLKGCVGRRTKTLGLGVKKKRKKKIICNCSHVKAIRSFSGKYNKLNHAGEGNFAGINKRINIKMYHRYRAG